MSDQPPDEYKQECLLNKAAFRRWALKKALQLRPGIKWERVSASFIEHAELKLMAMTADEIRRHPSTGITLKT